MTTPPSRAERAADRWVSSLNPVQRAEFEVLLAEALARYGPLKPDDEPVEPEAIE